MSFSTPSRTKWIDRYGIREMCTAFAWFGVALAILCLCFGSLFYALNRP